MEQYITYICEKCGKMSSNADTIKTCEAAHLGLTVDEKFQHDGLKEIARRLTTQECDTRNEATIAASDKAILELLEFEKAHGLKGEE